MANQKVASHTQLWAKAWSTHPFTGIISSRTELALRATNMHACSLNMEHVESFGMQMINRHLIWSCANITNNKTHAIVYLRNLAKKQKCKPATLQRCKIANGQGLESKRCKSARVQNANVQRCTTPRIHRCRNAESQHCKHAKCKFVNAPAIVQNCNSANLGPAENRQPGYRRGDS